MSLSEDYERRTAWKNEPVHGMFRTHRELANKVAPDGSYKPFFGSTVVFAADEQCSRTVREMQIVLHEHAGDMLASPLPASTFHMTLHDLVSPEMCASDPSDRESYTREIAGSLAGARAVVDEIKKEHAGKSITMRPDRVVNMVSKSLVLLLKPQSETDYELLADMYRRFDCIVSLPYPLTPHITLAYFRPGLIDGDRLGSAIELVQIRDNAQEFIFRTEALAVQTFRDMRTYF